MPSKSFKGNRYTKRIMKRLTELELSNRQLLDSFESLHSFVKEQVRYINHLHKIDADVGIRGNNTIILTGVFRGKAYVKFYDIGDGRFKAMVEELQWLSKHGELRTIDKPIGFEGSFNL